MERIRERTETNEKETESGRQRRRVRETAIYTNTGTETLCYVLYCGMVKLLPIMYHGMVKLVPVMLDKVPGKLARAGQAKATHPT
jgi:hypothetical protein